MSAFTILSSGTLIGLVLLGILIAVRSSYLPPTVRSPRLGRLALGCYAVAVVAGLLVWARDADGLGIATMLLGMPWSFVVALGLGQLPLAPAQRDTATWHVLLQALLFGTVLLNAWVIHSLGARLPALWTAPVPRTAR